MTSSSLVGSIFGSGEKGSSESASLSNLFEESAALPERPQHEAPERKPKRPPTKTDEKDGGTNEKERKKPKTPKTEDPASRAEETESGTTPTTEPPSKEDKEDAEERTIFVGNLPLDTTRKSLASMFKACGKVESARLRSVAAAGVKLPPAQAGDQNLVKRVCANTKKLDADKKSTAQGYVVFSDPSSVPAALQLNNTLAAGKHRLRVDRATPTLDASRSVFVGNLPYHADETLLQTHVATKCGFSPEQVEGVRVVRDKETLQCKGFGYVLLADKTLVPTALQKVHGSIYMKRELRVSVCGKRYKGRRGAPSDNVPSNKRAFEGKRASVMGGAAQRVLGGKKRRARGDTQKKPAAVARKAGVSKRAAAEAKVGKRIKKIQKRVAKGMGKARGK